MSGVSVVLRSTGNFKIHCSYGSHFLGMQVWRIHGNILYKLSTGLVEECRELQSQSFFQTVEREAKHRGW